MADSAVRAKAEGLDDGELLARCREFQDCQTRLRTIEADETAAAHLPARHPTVLALEDAWGDVSDRRAAIMEKVTGLVASGRDGLRAKAEIALWEMSRGSPETTERGVAWSLARDILGRVG
jgi:hypothetical protein